MHTLMVLAMHIIPTVVHYFFYENSHNLIPFPCTVHVENEAICII